MLVKRINPASGEHFKRGDLSLDGVKRFWAYRSRSGSGDKIGNFDEEWLSLADYEAAVQRILTKQQEFAIENRALKLTKRLNPTTGQLFNKGEQNDKGQYFIGYVSGQRTSSGHYGEAWGSRSAYLKVRVGLTFTKMKKRSKDKNIPLNVTKNYLFSILPDDMRCPILNMEMKFGGGNERSTSPSIDRFIPEKGYVKGNVAWVSLLANSVKSEKTSTELRMVADWMERQEIYQKHGFKEVLK